MYSAYTLPEIYFEDPEYRKMIYSIGSDIYETHKSIRRNATFSPWIYHEIETARTIRQHKKRKLSIKSNISHADSAERLTVSYPLNTSGFMELSIEALEKWANAREKNKKTHALDLLYKHIGISKRHPC